MPSGTIGIVWEDSQLGSLTHAHLGNPFFPASDHLLLAQHKLPGLVSVPGGIEFLRIVKHPCVVHHAGLAVLQEGAPVYWREGLHLQSKAAVAADAGVADGLCYGQRGPSKVQAI